MILKRMLFNGKRLYISFGIAQRFQCNSVRVRFAPSPTGYMHLGGLRTAFYNYLFARKNNGAFVLRIEDTDQKRLKVGSLENIQDMLEWTGLNPDESPIRGGPYGPYIQSQRSERYKEKAKELLKQGLAYHCFCSETRLDIIRREALKNRQNPCYDNKCRHLTTTEIEENLSRKLPFTVRFKIESGPISFDDIVYGPRTIDISEFEGDFIILKSDGLPTYHFACVVDDHDMLISHVLRGAEWLHSTTKHLMLHKAFGWEPPSFAHLPLLVNSDRTKLSKRQEALGVEFFKKQNYEPLAILNFLAGIGTGFGFEAGCHILELDDLCQRFNLPELNTNSCALDLPKLEIYNQAFLKMQLSKEITSDSLIAQFRTLMEKELAERLEKGTTHLPDEYIKKILLCYKDRISNLTELLQPDMQYLWAYPNTFEMKKNLVSFKISESAAVDGCRKLIRHLINIPEVDFSREKLTPFLKKCSTEENLSYVPFMRMLRIVLTGKKDGPGIAEILEMLGLEQSLKKLEFAVEILEERQCISKVD